MSQELGLRNVFRNRGPYTDFLHRYRLEAAAALAEEGDHRLEFFGGLTLVASDERNLRIAADHICRNGGNAPGCDGICLQHLSQIDIWGTVRQLRDLIRAGEYRRGFLRRCEIPKRPSSTELRTIFLPNAYDRIVMRAVAQVLQPLLHLAIDPLSFCWSRRGVQQALAYAQHLVITQQRTRWIVEDLRNAFDRVPRQRLLQILEQHVPCQEFCRFVLDLVEPPARRGILQGSSLSPMLLDVYLSHLLHRPWRCDSNLPPLLRYVDDVLCACRPADDIEVVYERLVAMFQSAGFQPKHGPEKAVVDLRRDTAVWLGYRLRVVQDRLEIRPKHFDEHFAESEPEARSLLLDRFARLHDRPEGWRHVDGVIQGIVTHLAPTLPHVDPRRIYGQILIVARDAGFEETLGYQEVLTRWQNAYAAWQEKCEQVGRTA